MSGLRQMLRRATADPNVVALLSLKLLLLAFFLLLNAMATYEEERTRAVIESLRDTFRGDVPAVAARPRPDAALGPLEDAGSLVARTARLFRQSVPGVRVDTEQDGRLLRLAVPTDQMFRPGSAALRAERLPMLERMTAGLEAREGGYALEFLHPTTVAAEAALPATALEVRRAGRFARTLQELGLPSRAIAVGLLPAVPGQAAAGRVVLTVRLEPQAARGAGAARR